MTLRAAILLLFALGCHSQDLKKLLEKAPPDIEEGLRRTVSEFYQAHVDGKFRLADQFVAEDSKDVFFSADKRRCRSFEIVKLTYSDNFARATAVVVCDTEMLMPMGGRFSVKMPLTSLWKLEVGRWWWYVQPSTEHTRQTPFGTLNSGTAEPSAAGGAFPAKPVDLKAISNLVKADRQVIRVRPAGESEDRVVVTNQMPGAVSLSLESPELPGLTVKLHRSDLKSGETAVVSARYDFSKDPPPAAATLRLVVSPTQQVIPIEIQFEPPAAK